ncbi:hypothetical protein SAY86_030775 [Trapa natans]|uniref:Uncharacterized protein n=1 Tax=Trapa natans TaxID=22666 RepID=A0AAN7M5P6_TRANT|nr:hypothetical protein SAY86_030775 [Trapa natans]
MFIHRHCKRSRPSAAIPFLALVMIIVSASSAVLVQARVLAMAPSSFFSDHPHHLQKQQGSYSRSKLVQQLGLVCKCCDDNGGNCKASWDGSCPNKLQCLPWKFS